jgi:hypothetical protein
MALGSVRSQFYYRHRTIILIGGLIAVYLFTRMAFVLRLPPFIDEATHILWARDMLNGNITAGAYDGRWVTIQIFALASLLPLEPLLIVRFVAILAGLFTMLAIVFTGRDLFSANDGFVAGIWSLDSLHFGESCSINKGLLLCNPGGRNYGGYS